jgi:serine/threonine protein kinase/Tfp pilus assembly protein PilF
MTGKTVYQYLILEKIGAGGKGVVYKAEDTRLKRLAALKFLSSQLLADPESRERFQREARAVAALNHPNIVTVYEINEWEGQLYIAMEYVAGRALNTLIIREKGAADHVSPERKESPLPLSDVFEIALQIGAGLKHAHGAGIVHRDLKPQNIIVCPDLQVKLLDFGLAKILSADPLTKESTSPGTLNYMAPEQLRGEAVDPLADIWSMGAVLYEVIDGRPPFLAESAEATIYSILFRDPAPFVRSGIPGFAGMEAVVTRALKKKREERYPSMDALIADLQALRQGTAERPVGVTPLTVQTRCAIAVLPFNDLSPKQDEEYFCHGLAEDLINALARVEGLKVVASASSFFSPSRSIDACAIGRKLQVQFVLEGSVRKSKKKLRISARLLQVVDGALLWSEKYDRVLEDIFAIQDEITMAIANNLQASILLSVKARQSRRYPRGTEVYNLFLKGRYFLNKRYSGGLQRSTDFFRQCIALDGDYALAHIGIADTLNFLGLHGFMAPKEAFPQAKLATLKALAIDAELGEAHASFGWINCFYDWDQPAAEKEYKQAIALEPGYANAHEWYALFLAMMGRFDEAFAEIAVALELDPLSLITNSIQGLIHIFSRNFDKARQSLEKALELDPDFLLALIWLGESYTFIQAPDKAIELLERAVKVDPEMTYAQSALGFAYTQAGESGKAREVLARLDALGRKRYISIIQAAHPQVGLGDREQVFALYEKALEQRDPFFLWFKVAPQFDGIRTDPRFRRFLEKTGLAR